MSRRKTMQRRIRTILLLAGAAILAACVTINVYFPAAAVKELSNQIEDEVQKKAAEAKPAAGAAGEGAAPGAAKPSPSPAPLRGEVQLFDALLRGAPAYAQAGEVAAPEVSSPAIRKIIDARAARAGALDQYKGQGVVGENNRALVEARNLESIADLKARADVQRLIKAEN